MSTIPPAAAADISNRFTYHLPTPGQTLLYRELRYQAAAFALHLAENVPPGREQALAMTNLEQVVFWANAGIARSGIQ